MLIMYVSKVLLSVTMTESSRNLYFNFNTQQREIKQEKELEQCAKELRIYCLNFSLKENNVRTKFFLENILKLEKSEQFQK